MIDQRYCTILGIVYGVSFRSTMKLNERGAVGLNLAPNVGVGELKMLNSGGWA